MDDDEDDEAKMNVVDDMMDGVDGVQRSKIECRFMLLQTRPTRLCDRQHPRSILGGGSSLSYVFELSKTVICV